MNKLQTLSMYVSNLPEKDKAFATSLLTQASRRQLSPKQEYWVGILADRAVPPTPAPSVRIEKLSVSGIVDLIRRNNNAKRPKIRFLMGDVECTLSKATTKSRYPNTLNVVCGNVWHGRVYEDGRYEPSSRIDEAKQVIVIETLRSVALDPARAAAEYGKKTGHCCFCALKLDDARSLEVGYGAVCAKNYRLPWGKRMTELQKEFLIKKLTDDQAFG